MTKFLTWLKSLFIHPKKESNQMSEPLNDATTVQPVAAAPVTAEVVTPATEVKAGVQDFEAALAFVESGVAQLGAAAKDELKALAKKYL
ncbi:hypothetical protein FD737_10000 [Pantoea sp. Seng]|uniref:hypothetical protein n=1 Tax=Pantoea sp. Seng TaxID=2576761 RepID=UPI00132AB9CE|nr:hypothetical protein [Pantoea sp. Seng]MXP53412.1 hypothetical protein [Pantoea sp. Seng]